MRRVLVPQHISEQLPAPGSVPLHARGESMGTSWSVQVLVPPEGRKDGATASVIDAQDPVRVDLGGYDVAALTARVTRQLGTVVAQMSHWLPDSDLGRFNDAPPGSWHDLPAEFYAVMDCAVRMAHASAGAFEPYAGALVDLWGFGPRARYDQPGFRPPTDAQIAVALRLRQAAVVEFDHTRRRLRQPGGVRIDLSAIAKGYAVDLIAASLDALGLRHFLVEVGGELRGAGMKMDGQPWWVALEAVPGGDGDEMVLALHDLAVATSGDYRRSFEKDGARRSHSIDPRNGRPIAHGLASVSVIHPQCMLADELSTALTVLGPQAGFDFAEREGVAARFIVRTGAAFEERLSTRLRAYLA